MKKIKSSEAKLHEQYATYKNQYISLIYVEHSYTFNIQSQFVIAVHIVGIFRDYYIPIKILSPMINDLHKALVIYYKLICI